MTKLRDLKNRIEKKEHGAYAAILDADPTAGKVYSHWLIDLFLKSRLLTEDLPKARLYLETFRRIRNNLKQKDVAVCKNLPELHRVVADHLPQETAVESKDLFHSASENVVRNSWPIRQDDVIELYKDDNFRVIIPLSTAAAMRYGRGTSWCTAYTRSSNHFWNYASKGPLLIVLTRDETGRQRKYQLHSQSGHFKDESDTDINLFKLFAKTPLEGIIAEYPSMALAYVPLKQRTEEMCLATVRKDGIALRYVPAKFRNEQMCGFAVEQNKTALPYVPYNVWTEEMCLAIVRKDGTSLQYVPAKFRNEEACHLALEQSKAAFPYVPYSLRTEEMSRSVVRVIGCMLHYVPLGMRTTELCRMAVELDGMALENVPRKLRKEEICRIAVRQNSEAVSYLPWNMDKEKLGVSPVKRNNLSYMSEGLQAEEAALAAMSPIVEMARRSNQSPVFSDFHSIDNRIQDKVTERLGLRFDERGYMYICDQASMPALPSSRRGLDPSILAT